MKNIKLTYILILLCLIPSVLFAQNFSTTNVDDYTNSKNGVASKAYTFTIDGTGKNALGKDSSNTNMTWEQWLNIKADGFNNQGYYVVTTNSGSDTSKTAYTVKYNTNGGSGTFNDDLVYEGNSVSLPSISRTGYTFNGWYTLASGGTKVGDANNEYKPTSSLTLYAQWTPITYTITCNLNDNEISKASISGQKTSYTVETETFTLPTPTRKGYAFTGWIGSNGSAAQTNVTINKGSIGDKSYTANWTKLDFTAISEATLTTWYDELPSTLTFDKVSGGSNEFEFTSNSNTIISSITNGELEIKEDASPGKYTEIITVKDKYTGDTKTIEFTIYVKYLMTYENTTVEFEKISYTGKVIEPKESVMIKLNNENVVLNKNDGADYILFLKRKTNANGTIIPNIDSGTYDAYLYSGNDRIYMTTKSEIAGDIASSYLIFKLTVEKADTSLLTKFSYQDEWGYTGEEIKPEIYSASSKDDSISLNESQIKASFDITYNNNINPTENATITLTPKKTSNFTGDSITLPFKIVAQKMNISVIKGYAVYNGQPQDGGAKVTVADNVKGTKVSYATQKNGTYQNEVPKFTDVGTYTVYYKVEHEWYSTSEGTLTIQIVKDDNPLVISNIKNNESTYPFSFEFDYSLTYPTDVIVNKNVLNASIEMTQNDDKKGGHIKVTPVAKNKEYSDEIEFQAKETNNTYFSTATVSYSVKLGTIGITTTDETLTYDGNEHEIKYSVTGPSGVSSSFRYYDGTKTVTTSTLPKFKNAGRYEVYYSASKTGYSTKTGQVIMVINARTIKDAKVEIETEEDGFIYYDGSQKTPNVTVTIGNKTLAKGIDYDVMYTNNIEVGNATVIITGKGNYTDSISKTFTITSKNDTSVKITWRELNDKNVLVNKEASYDKTSTWTVDENTTNELVLNTRYTGNSQNAYAELVLSPSNGQVYYTDENREATENDSQQVPTKVQAGKYKINFLIKWHGYKDVKGYFYLNIEKLTLNIPTPETTSVCLKIDGDNNAITTSPKWINYNPIYMSMGNTTSETKKGSYQTTFELVDKANTQWSDGIVSTKTVEWQIGDNCNRTEELVYELNVVYGVYKELMLENRINDDGSTTFENQKTMFTRPGYVQAGWVENRDDRSVKYDIAANVINLAEYEGDNVDLYALWERAIYTLDIDYDGGRLPSTSTTTNGTTRNNILTNPSVVAYDTYFTLTEPVKPGYTFMGWEIWNMDETEHYIGTIITTDTTYETMENVFKNLTSVANSTVYFKAKWEANKLWTKNYAYTVKSSVSKYVINNAYKETENGSGNYKYEITSVTPNSGCNFVVTNNSLDYGYSSCPNKGTLQGFSIDDNKNLTVPSYLKVSTYTIAIKTTDEFTKKKTTFYIDVTVKNPTITIVDKNGKTEKTYEYEPSQTIKQWTDSSHNNDGSSKKYDLITECHND